METTRILREASNLSSISEADTTNSKSSELTTSIDPSDAAAPEPDETLTTEEQFAADRRKIRAGRRLSLDKGKAKAEEGLAKQDKSEAGRAGAGSTTDDQHGPVSATTDKQKLMPGGFPGDGLKDNSNSSNSSIATTTAATTSVVAATEQEKASAEQRDASSFSISNHIPQKDRVEAKAAAVAKPRPSLLDDDEPVSLASTSNLPKTETTPETADHQKTLLDFTDVSGLDPSVTTDSKEATTSDKNTKQDQWTSLIDLDEPATELGHIPTLSLADQSSWASMAQVQPPNALKTMAPATSRTDIFKKSITSTSSNTGGKGLLDPRAFNEKVWDNFDDRNTSFDFSIKPEYEESGDDEEEDQLANEAETYVEARPRAQSLHLHKSLLSSSLGDEQYIGRFSPAVRSQPKDVRKASIVTIERVGPENPLADRTLGMFASKSRKNPPPISASTDMSHSSTEPVLLYPPLESETSGQRDQAPTMAGMKDGSKTAFRTILEDKSDVEHTGRAGATTADSDTDVSSRSKNKAPSASSLSDMESNSDPFGLNTPEAIAQRERWDREDHQKKASYGLSTSQDDATSASPAGDTDTDGAYISTGYDSDLKKPAIDAQSRKEQEEVSRPRSPTAPIRRPWDDLPPLISISDMKFGSGNHQQHATHDFFAAERSGTTATSSAAATSQEPARTKLYPPAPPEPWGPPQPAQDSAGLRHRPSMAKSAPPVGPITSDPAVTFLGSMRSAGTKSANTKASSAILGEPPKVMLGDKVDFAGAGAVKPMSTRTVTLPANPKDASVLRGRYELPSIKEIQSWNTSHSLGPYALRRLVLNVGSLLFASWVWRRAAVKTLTQKLASSFGYSPLYWIDWVLVIVFWINIVDVLWRYTKAANKFEKLPLTPEQRLRLGLEPVEPSVPGAVPIFQKSTSSTVDLLEVPLQSTYVAPSTQRSTGGMLHSQLGKSSATNSPASIIWSKSMSRSLQQHPQVHTKSELLSLIKTVESREGAENEWKMAEAAAAEANKRAVTFAYGVGAAGAGADATGRKPDVSLGLSVSRYQPALRTALSQDRISKTELQKDGLPVWTPAKVFKTLKISEAQLDQWVLRMRKWLWTKVVSPMCDEMEAVDKAFEAAGFGYLDCKSATMFTTSVVVPQKDVGGASTAGATAGTAGTATAGTSSTAGTGAASTTNPLAWGAATTTAPALPSAFAAPTQPALPPTPTSLMDLNNRWGNDEMVKRRMVLEAYLAVPGVTNRKYIVERIKAFGPLLSQFKWDSEGVRWENGRKTWTPDLPTDSQILMHLFATFLDLAMPAQPTQGYGRFPFSYKHLVAVDAKPDPNVAIQIKQSSKNPPCYHLVVNGNVWEIVPKRMNIWYTLVLFIYVVMKESGGYLGQAHFGSRVLGLDAVVEV